MTDPRPQIPLPPRMEIVRRHDGIALVRHWRGWRTIFFTAFAVAWNGFLVVWYSMAAATGNTSMMLFPLLHVAVGLGLAYYVVASWVNRTYVAATGSKLAVRHEPVPWFGKRDLDAHRVEQLWSKERIHRTKNGTRRSWELRARMRDGADVKVVGGLDAVEQALFLEQELEKWLGCEDAKIAGEVSRS
jgi:hypothetical protein